MEQSVPTALIVLIVAMDTLWRTLLVFVVLDHVFLMVPIVTAIVVGSVAMVPLIMTANNVVDNVVKVVLSVICTALAPYAVTTPIGKMRMPMNVDVWKMVQNASPEKTVTIAVMEHMMTMGILVEVPA
jgi:hypothetical protein